MGATPPTAHARGLTTPVPLASNDRTTAARKPPSATARSKPSVTRNTPQNGLPKGINYKLLRALKPGKQRQAYLKRLMKRCGAVKLQQVTETIPSATIGARPWLSVAANESLTASKLPATTTTDISYGPSKKRKRLQPQCVDNTTDCQRLDIEKERQESVNRYRKSQQLEVKPGASQKLALTNFVWPRGMNREEFLARRPGKDRMAFLARHIKKNDIELQRIGFVRPNAPIGRKPEPLSHPHCACSSSEACASCSRCVELHCVCGLTGRRRRALCRESRACSCTLIDPTNRCKLCYGCRQTHGLSHCRCVLHQRLLWIKRHPGLGVMLTKEEEKAVCSCFLLAHRHGGAAVTKAKEEKARKEIERVRRIKRAAGFSSSENVYRSKKVMTFLGNEGLESDYDDGVDDGLGSEVLPPTINGVIPRTMTARMLGAEHHPASYHPLFRSEGCSLLESMEPRNGRIRCRSAPAAFSSDAMQEEICRGLENYAFELARDAAMPPDDLVDYVVYMASIKASNVGELVGTFDDSAAVAVGIVIEEYMAQLVEDHVLHQQSLCLPSKASVQAFTQEILHGFNWQLFQRQHPCSCSKTADSVVTLVDKEAVLVDKLAALVLHEFVSLQPQDFDVKDHSRDLLAWIRSAIAIPPSLMTDDASCRSSVEKVDDQHRGETSTRFESCQDPAVVEARGTPRIRMSVKANAVHGNPSYKLHYAAKCMDGHHVEASVGGLDSKVKANATMSQLAKVVQHHEQKSMGTPKDSLPAPRPPTVLQPPHCKEGEDPYSSMYDHVWKHFDEYACRKRQMSSDANRSSTSSDGEGRTTSRELPRNGEARAHCSEI